MIHQPSGLSRVSVAAHPFAEQEQKSDWKNQSHKQQRE
jgi:hypothetical protein